jgi:hypothetical protein
MTPKLNGTSETFIGRRHPAMPIRGVSVAGEVAVGSPLLMGGWLRRVIDVVSQNGVTTVSQRAQTCSCSPLLWITLWIRLSQRGCARRNMTISLDWSHSGQPIFSNKFR